MKKSSNQRSPSKRQDSELARAKRVLRAHLPELRDNYSVKSLGVFGSYVRGEQKKRSDLDLLVEFEQAPSLFKYIELENHLTDLVGIKVDLVMKKTLKPHIGRYILTELVPL
ncbi:MAG: nucleotidyltransferase family protein [Chloroflexi bacterium]|nr:nucleotidyltransferase family protein [Chloroflexota bacterium]